MSKKHKRKKYKEKYHKKRRESSVLDDYGEEYFTLWFNGDESKIDEFRNFLITKENKSKSLDFSTNIFDNVESYYDKELDKIMNKKCASIWEVLDACYSISHINKIKRKNAKYKQNTTVAYYMNTKYYRKRIFDKKEYREDLKKAAKRERHEYDEMRKLGYIKSKDPDDEYEKMLKLDESVKQALSDAYDQKHF